MSATRQGMTVAATVKNAPKVKDVKDASLARQAFAQFPSGVSVLAVDIGGERHAMVASSFMVGVSLEPCLAAVAIQKGSETWSSIRRAETIGVSIFASGQGQLTRQLAGRDRAKRFDQVAVEVDESGALYIEDAAMWLETSIYQDTDAGDHWMVLLQVSRIGVDVDTDPLIWHGARFRELVRDASIDVR